uniref:Integrase catalytic domain-containing protein n=1 Tax=Meloidogyne hapla TaxID=6305 RepID=A0A1I8BE20_MELHA
MANKFILIPEDIYRGLLTQPITETGNIGLDYTRKNLENIKRQHTNAEIKNVNYNQELRRYLHMLKDQNDKPMNVAVRQMEDPALEQIKKLLPLLQSNSKENTPSEQYTSPIANKNEYSEKISPLDENYELKDDSMYTAGESPDTGKEEKPSKIKQKTHEIFDAMKKSNLERYDVKQDGKILKKKDGKEILGSNAQKSLECILRTGISGKLRWGELTPPGTAVLENKLKKDDTIWPLIEKAREESTPKRKLSGKNQITEGKWGKPKDMINAFEKVLSRMEMYPHRIFSDKGTEFCSKEIMDFFKEKDIEKYTANASIVKASLAERCIRNLKQRLYRFMSEKHTLKWTEALSKVVNAVNHSKCRVLGGLRPVDVGFNNAKQVREKVFGPVGKNKSRRKPRFEENEHVRMSRNKNMFAKGYLPNFSDEILQIDLVKNNANPNRYRVRDDKGELFKGYFYPEELTRVRKDENTSYRIEKIIRSRKKTDGSREYYVKFFEYPEPEWVDETQFV